MEIQKSKVFIKTDTSTPPCVTDCNGGYTAPADLVGWVKIDEGTGDRYNLCASHYFDGGLYTKDGIPRYKYADGVCSLRTDAEIEADRSPTLGNIVADKLAEINAGCDAAIAAGCAVTLTDGTAGHISLTLPDQINLSTAQAAILAGGSGYAYHLDGALCEIYSAADIAIMAKAATAHILYHQTYCNHIRAWAKRCETTAEVQAITYGAELPEDLAAHMAAVLAAAEGGNE